MAFYIKLKSFRKPVNPNHIWLVHLLIISANMKIRSEKLSRVLYQRSFLFLNLNIILILSTVLYLASPSRSRPYGMPLPQRESPF